MEGNMDAWTRAFSVRAGKRLRNLRCQRGLTQAEVAAAVGVTQATLSNYELGKRPMLLATAIALASVLDIPLETLTEVAAVRSANPIPGRDRVTPIGRSVHVHPRPLLRSRG